MSEYGERRDGERVDKGPRWVWWSSEESAERGTISVLACAEVAAGIWLYWWFLPWWLGTNLHLLISVFVAPMLLLRSPASLEAALAAFERYLHVNKGFSLRSTRGAVEVLLFAGLAGLVSWMLFETWLSGHEGWSLVWRAGITGWVSLMIGFTVAAARGFDVAAAVAGAGVAAGALALAPARARYLTLAFLAIPAFALGIVLGVSLRSIIIRIGATIRHLAEGWGRLSVNSRSLVWAHDFRRPPELLPGIERHPTLRRFRIRRLLGVVGFRGGFDAVETSMVFLVLPVFFIPAWLYRLSLKSTCWFWWPLVFSQTSGRAAAREVAEDAEPGPGVIFREHSKTWLAKFLFGLSLIFLVTAIGVPERAYALLPVSKDGADLVGAFGDTILLMLPCAAVQMALFLFCDRFLARAEASHLGSLPRTAFRGLISLRQFLLWSAVFAALALHLEHWAPVLTPFAEFVEVHYFSRFPLQTWT